MGRYLTSLALLLTSLATLAQNRPTANWPKVIPLAKLSITLYQPAVEGVNGNYLEARAAFNLFDGTRLPIFGALWLRARMHINQTTQTITYDKITILDVNFPEATAADKKEFMALLTTVAPTWQLESTLADLQQASAAVVAGQQASAALNNSPPNIFYEQTPTELIYIDGAPIMANIDGSLLYQYVVNTP